MHRFIKTQDIFLFDAGKEPEQLLFSRRTSVLVRSVFCLGVCEQERYKRRLGYAHSYSPIYVGEEKVFYEICQLEEEKKKFLRLYEKDNESFHKFAGLCEEKGKSIMKYSFEIKKLDPAKIDSKKLEACFSKLYVELLDFMVFLLMPVSMQKHLEDNLALELKKRGLQEHKFEECLTALTSPNKNNLSYDEQKSILELSILFKKNKHTKEFRERIMHHLFNYSQIGIKYGIGKPWTEENIMERIEFLSKHNPEDKLQHLTEQALFREKTVEEIIEELKLGKEARQLVDIIRTFVYLRTFRTDVISGAIGNFFDLLVELAKRNSLSTEDILNCFPDEIAEGNYPEKSELKERQHIVMKGLNGKAYYICGVEAEKIINSHSAKSVDKKIKTTLEIVRGRIANYGLAIGKAKILATNEDLSKVDYGDIIISHMTTPDFVPAMEKAAGFVTDEGGILCHAAIVSREMNKPCIIGTTNATTTFNDNDNVQLDAHQGTAKKISEE